FVGAKTPTISSSFRWNFPARDNTPSGILVLANDRLSGTRLTVHAFVYSARSKRRPGTWERSMRNRAAIADQIDYWIRRHAIRASCGTHPPQNKSKLNTARNSLLGYQHFPLMRRCNLGIEAHQRPPAFTPAPSRHHFAIVSRG